MDPQDETTLMTLEDAGRALGYKGYSALRRAATEIPPRLKTTVLGKSHRFTTPAWLYAYETEHLQAGNYRRGEPRRPRRPHPDQPEEQPQ